jgi:FkbM family methyltransferase
MKFYIRTNLSSYDSLINLIPKIIPPKIKSILKLIYNNEFRQTYFDNIRKKKELKRIKSIPRFISSKSNLLGTYVFFSDSASFLFMYDEIFEKGIYDFVSNIKRPYIIDCGANIGLSIIYFKKIYPLSTILGFEPDPGIYNILKENIKNFGFQDIVLEDKGVWNQEITMSFFSDGADGGRILLESESKNLINIHTIRLKDFLTKQVDLLKIDIEGAETVVLKDCSENLKYVDKIFVEYHSFTDRQQNLQELLEILCNAGFRYYIQQVGISSATPFIKVNSFNKIDNQLNIFAYRP